jgi:peptide/nickel transport system permease protein
MGEHGEMEIKEEHRGKMRHAKTIRHVLLNIISLLITIATVYVSTMIMAEPALSFLGLGVQPPTPSRGGFLAKAELSSKSPGGMTSPGLAILFTVLAINMLGVGDGMKNF